jgi:hypothetical protein
LVLKLGKVIDVHARAIETVDLETRIAKLEGANDGNNQRDRRRPWQTALELWNRRTVQGGFSTYGMTATANLNCRSLQ